MSLFPDKNLTEKMLRPYVYRALDRTEFCFQHVDDKYFYNGVTTTFNHLHSDQYAMFLYYLANSIWQMEGDLSIAAKVYCLNKALNALDIYYEVGMPDIFLLIHPQGTVLGRGKYANYFVAYQRCSVGANPLHEFPVIEEGVAMYGASMLIGRSHVGRNSRIAAGSIVMDLEVPPDKVVFGCHPHVQFKSTRQDVIDRNFRNYGPK